MQAKLGMESPEEAPMESQANVMKQVQQLRVEWK